MPELPEVETVRRGLEPSLVGRRVERVQLNRADLRIPFPENLAEKINKQAILSIDRRAKYLLIHLGNGLTLILHLGMSGQILVLPQRDYQPRLHDHVRIDFDDGNCLIFRDPRRFGLLTMTETHAIEKHELIKHLGPEPLGNAFHSDYLEDALSRRKGPIKTAIMDQKLVVGVGNIYACEALFRSYINPLSPCNANRGGAGALVTAIQDVLRAAIDSGGSTLRDYVRSNGELGYFQHQFRIYGREGEQCYRCATSVTRTVQAGRSTYFCYKCQNVKSNAIEIQKIKKS